MADQQAQGPTFNIEKLYLKDLSLEVPNAPQIFLERDAPTVDVQLHHESQNVEGDIFQTTLTITVTSKVAEKTVFLVETAYAGIFTIRGVPQQEMGPVLGIGAPNILFPYAREVISDAVVRAGFPPILLNPINFEALYLSQQQQSQPGIGNGGASPIITSTH